MTAKHLLFVQSHAPHGTIFGQEGLDATLMGSAFTQCSVLFTGDGVYQLLTDQDPSRIGSRDFARGYQALKDYGVEAVYCIAEDLINRHLTTDDLMIEVQLLQAEDVRTLFDAADVILDF